MSEDKQDFYIMLIEFIKNGKTSWGKVELVAAIKDLYIEFLTRLKEE